MRMTNVDFRMSNERHQGLCLRFYLFVVCLVALLWGLTFAGCASDGGGEERGDGEVEQSELPEGPSAAGETDEVADGDVGDGGDGPGGDRTAGGDADPAAGETDGGMGGETDDDAAGDPDPEPDGDGDIDRIEFEEEAEAEEEAAPLEPGQAMWSGRFGDGEEQSGWALAVDSNGNIILAGNFSGTINLGGYDLVSAGESDEGKDIFLAKFTPRGGHLWSRRFGDLGYQFPYALAVDSNDNIYMTGEFSEAINFGGRFESFGESDIFLAKFAGEGATIWAKQFGDADAQAAIGLAVDKDDNVIITGEFNGSITFGDEALQSAGAADVFLAKFSPLGAHRWSGSFGDEQLQRGRTVTTDAEGNVYVAGDFSGTLNFGGQDMSGGGGGDIFLAGFDPEGGHLWSKGFGDEQPETVSNVAIDGLGRLLVLGAFGGTLDFGRGPMTALGDMDMFLAVFDAGGGLSWSRAFGRAEATLLAHSLAVDPENDWHVTGEMTGAADFGGESLQSYGKSDVFWAKLDARGEHLWSRHFGDNNHESGSAAVVDYRGDIILTGSFSGLIDFGNGILNNEGARDVFLVKFYGGLEIEE